MVQSRQLQTTWMKAVCAAERSGRNFQLRSNISLPLHERGKPVRMHGATNVPLHRLGNRCRVLRNKEQLRRGRGRETH